MRDVSQRWPAGLALFALCAEIGVTAYVLANLPSDRTAQWIHLLIPLATVVVGGVLCTLAFLADRHSRVTQLAFGLHAAALLLVVLYSKYQSHRSDKAAVREHERKLVVQAERALQTSQTAALTALVRAYRYPAALKYLREHPALRLGYGAPLPQLLCPEDKRAPDQALLKELALHGVPADGDLLAASARCSVEAVRAVMQLGVPVQALTKRGASALSAASWPKIVSFLVQAGLDVNARDQEGRTALMLHRSAAVTARLLEHGADARAVDSAGRSALHYPAPPDQLVAIFELLLQAGADVNQEMIGSSLTPLLVLASHTPEWSQAAADVLVAHGARPEDQLEAIRQLITQRPLPGEAPTPIDACLRWPGVDLRGQGGSLLVSALQAQRFNLVELLLALGANPLARTDDDGESAISYLDARYDYGKVDERLRAKLRAAAEASRVAPLGETRVGNVHRADVMVGVLGQPLYAGPERSTASSATASNVALVLQVRAPWVRVLAGDGTLGWLEAPRHRPCGARVLARAAQRPVSIEDAAWQDALLFDGPARQLRLRVADADWTEASELRVDCPAPEARIGVQVAPFVTDPWPASAALGSAEERGDIRNCLAARQTLYTGGRSTAPRVAALYACESATGPQQLLVLGEPAAAKVAYAIPLTRAALLRSEELDLDGDGSHEWILELMAGGAEVDRRDLWIVDATASRALSRTLGYSDETSPGFRTGWVASAGQGISSATLADGRTTCLRLGLAEGALTEQPASAAFCRCAVQKLKGTGRPTSASVDLRGCRLD